MNKKVLLLIAVLLCGIGSEAVAQEKSKTWTLQAGIGYGQTEYLGDAFASGFYVGKRLANVMKSDSRCIISCLKKQNMDSLMRRQLLFHTIIWRLRSMRMPLGKVLILEVLPPLWPLPVSAPSS